MRLALAAILLCAASLTAQTNSLFDVSESRTFTMKGIEVVGEVRNPGMVDFSSLAAVPVRSAPIHELAIENGKQVYKGAFFVSGWSLYDILKDKTVAKAPENAFKPPVDQYVIVENAKGDRAVFSWGEIYYRDGFNILISRTVQAIDPARAKVAWPLFSEPRLVCASDLVNARFISNPTRITVKSFHGAGIEKGGASAAREFRIVNRSDSTMIGDMPTTVEKRKNRSFLYGHGMGYKGILEFTGYLLKDALSATTKFSAADIGRGIAVISAADGYRSVFSLSEIVNRNDNQDFLLNEVKKGDGGRYTLIANDFFADRNVRSVSRIELVYPE